MLLDRSLSGQDGTSGANIVDGNLCRIPDHSVTLVYNEAHFTHQNSVCEEGCQAGISSRKRHSQSTSCPTNFYSFYLAFFRRQLTILKSDSYQTFSITLCGKE